MSMFVLSEALLVKIRNDRMSDEPIRMEARLAIEAEIALQLNRIADALEAERTPKPKRKRAEQAELVPAKLSAKDLVEGYQPTPDEVHALLDAYPRPLLWVELDRWKDHLRSNGYRVGKNPLRDPAAAFRTWLRNAALFTARAQAAGMAVQGPSPLFKPAEAKRT